MYTSFEITNFRCFDHLKIDNLARVNLIAGKNNVGKTALLEALFIYCGAYNPNLAMRVNAFRGLANFSVGMGSWAEAPWDSLFNGFDSSKQIEFSAKNQRVEERIVKLRGVSEPKELEKIALHIMREVGEGIDLSSSAGPAKVLSLLYQGVDNGESGEYYILLDRQRGLIEPVTPAPPFQSFFLSARLRINLEETARRFSNLDIAGELDVLVDVLRIVEPRLQRLTLGYSTSAQPVIHGDIGVGRLMPIVLMGDGLGRLTDLVLAIANAKNGIVLVDEFENGLHYSVMTDVWKAIGKAAREFNTQVFATTHSRECILAAHRAFSEQEPYDFGYFRLQRVKDEGIQVAAYDEESLEASFEVGFEVR